jgi:hypothetical protein
MRVAQAFSGFNTVIVKGEILWMFLFNVKS